MIRRLPTVFQCFIRCLKTPYHAHTHSLSLTLSLSGLDHFADRLSFRGAWLAPGRGFVRRHRSRSPVFRCVGCVTWGSGPLGHGDRQMSPRPKCVDAGHLRGSRCAVIAAGVQHILTAAIDALVFSWGRGKCGCLGVGDEEDRLVPTAIELEKSTGDSEKLGRRIDIASSGWRDGGPRTSTLVCIP